MSSPVGTKRPARLLAPVLVVMLLAGCSGPVSEAEAFAAVAAEASTLQSALTETMAMEGATAADASWAAAADSLEDFEATALRVRGTVPDVDDAAHYYARSAGYLLNLVRQGELEQARSVQQLELAPARAGLETALRPHLGGGDRSPATSSGLISRGLGVALAAAVLVGAGRALAARRAARREPVALASPAPVLLSDPAPGEVDGTALWVTDASRAARGGIRNSDLAEIVDASLARFEKAGWEVAVDVPDHPVAVDPLRLRRVIGNLLLSATSHGAEHIGIVAEEEDGRVVVSVGDDGTLSKAEPANEYGHPAEVDHQIGVARQLLAGMGADIEWMALDGVSLYVLHLARGGEVEAFGGHSAGGRTPLHPPIAAVPDEEGVGRQALA